MMVGLLLVGVISVVLCGSVHAQEGAGEQKYISMDFDQVDINVFIKFISELTGKNFVVDDKVRGKVTVLSPTRISVNEAFKVFESVLEVNGFTVVESGDVFKVVPSVRARQKNVETRTSPRFEGRPSDKFVTQIIPLRYASSAKVRKLLVPMVSKEGVLVDYPPSSTLIVTDYYSNIQRLMRIVQEIDVQSGDVELLVVSLKYANAGKLAMSLGKLLQAGRPAAKEADVIRPQVIADERLNALMILVAKEDLSRVRRLVRDLDLPTPRGTSTVHVVKLDNAVAEDLAAVLNGLAGKSGQDAKGEPIISKNARIVADKSTNSLVVTAEPDEFDALEEIIDQLDSPRKQVFVEALIMDVTTSKAQSIGVSWTVGDDISNLKDDTVLFGGSNQGGLNSFFNSDGSLADTLVAPSGFSVGVLSAPISIGGYEFFDLGAILQASRSDSDFNVISTPQIMTLDNEEASVVVAQNIPFVTTSNTDAANTDYTSQSFEYKDVGITLKITPQINDRNSVRLKIYQEVSDVVQSTVSVGSDLSVLAPTTRKRTAETAVEVSDGQTVVIAGLIEKTDTTGEKGVPGLSDIPGLGWLFKTRSTESGKTNLFIFLTPHIVDSPGDAMSIYMRKARNIESVRYGLDGRLKPLTRPMIPAPPMVR
jgi:general secretion pathway protein D